MTSLDRWREITGGGANATEAQIRNWIANYYNTRVIRPKWVLLMGDAEFIPTNYDEISPFVNGQAVGRILGKQLDLVKSNQKSATDALRAAAQQINEEIEKTIARDPELRKRYEALVNLGRQGSWSGVTRLR